LSPVPKYLVEAAEPFACGMWRIVHEAWNEVWEEYWPSDEPWSNVRPPISPVIRRHPPTYREWLLSLPWKPMGVLVPVDNSPDEGRSRLRLRGYRDRVTMNCGRPLRLRFARLDLRPPSNSRRLRKRRRIPKYSIVFPEGPDAPEAPPEDLVRKVEDLLRRAIKLGKPMEALDPELAMYIALDSFHLPRVTHRSASQAGTTPSEWK
jgi:hypothetical protein